MLVTTSEGSRAMAHELNFTAAQAAARAAAPAAATAAQTAATAARRSLVEAGLAPYGVSLTDCASVFWALCAQGTPEPEWPEAIQVFYRLGGHLLP